MAGVPGGVGPMIPTIGPMGGCGVGVQHVARSILSAFAHRMTGGIVPNVLDVFVVIEESLQTGRLLDVAAEGPATHELAEDGAATQDKLGAVISR